MARAAVLHAVGDSELDLRDDVSTVAPGPEQVKVAIKATGVCHSDVSTMTGVPPTVVGHEGAGVVAEIGERVTDVAVGDHVVVNWTCGGRGGSTSTASSRGGSVSRTSTTPCGPSGTAR